MLSPKTVELLTKKLLASLLDECGATNASEGEMVLNKLVAIATQSVETLVNKIVIRYARRHPGFCDS